MKNKEIISKLVGTSLKEEPVTIDGIDANLIIRELDADKGLKIIQSSADKGTVDRKHLLARIVLYSLRNADEPGKPLLFASEQNPNEADESYMHILLSQGMKTFMQAATRAMELSGLNNSIDQEKKD